MPFERPPLRQSAGDRWPRGTGSDGPTSTRHTLARCPATITAAQRPAAPALQARSPALRLPAPPLPSPGDVAPHASGSFPPPYSTKAESHRSGGPLKNETHLRCDDVKFTRESSQDAAAHDQPDKHRLTRARVRTARDDRANPRYRSSSQGRRGLRYLWACRSLRQIVNRTVRRRRSAAIAVENPVRSSTSLGIGALRAAVSSSLAFDSGDPLLERRGRARLPRGPIGHAVFFTAATALTSRSAR